MSKEKIKASEVAGQLRKMANMYDVFKHAADAATVLDEYEAREKKLKKSVEVVQAEFDDLDSKCDILYTDVQKHKEVLSNLQDSISAAKENKVRVLHDTEVRAKEKADGIVNGAVNELNALKSVIAELNSKFKHRKEDADKEYSALCEKIKVIKENALKALS